MRPSRWILVGLLVAVVVGIGATRAIGAQHDDQRMGEVVRVTPTPDPSTSSSHTTPPRQPGSSPAGSARPTPKDPSGTRTGGPSSTSGGDNGSIDRTQPPRDPDDGAPQVSHRPPAAGDDDDEDDDDHWDSDDDDDDEED